MTWLFLAVSEDWGACLEVATPLPAVFAHGTF